MQYAPLPQDVPFRSEEKIDLLILGVSPELAANSSALSRIAASAPFPVLFLVDSKSLVGLTSQEGKRDFLAKPFGPYGLKEKVEKLLLKAASFPDVPAARSGAARYVDFPYIPSASSLLARRFALTYFPILIIGEAGCGQEQLARDIHSLNGRAGPWISGYAPEISGEHLSQKVSQLSTHEKEAPRRLTLFLSGVDSLNPSAQASLLVFLEEEEAKGKEFWLLSTSRVDLLERVYRGEFLSPLYYRLATLTLRLPPLRERVADLPSLARCLAQEYAGRLGLEKVSFSPEALDRLCDYLWFGNIQELEAVIARTLAVQRKNLIDAPDLIFGAAEESRLPPGEEAKKIHEVPGEAAEGNPEPIQGDSATADLGVLIHELAHELKNPMVTIKTFAQLLRERFDDAAFRLQFQETVSGDIERMDELLESLLDFSRLNHPATERILLQEELRRIVEELSPECQKREVAIRWREGEGIEVWLDGAQLRYAFTNVFRTALAQVKSGGEIRIDMARTGGVTVSYVREAGPMKPLSHYLDLPSCPKEGEALPLQLLLARILLRRNGGRIQVHHPGGEKVEIQIELPVS